MQIATEMEFITHCEHRRYSVIPKTKKCLDEIDKFIKENHFDECGIIYCLSRMDCEKVAEKLQVSLSYHPFVLFEGVRFSTFKKCDTMNDCLFNLLCFEFFENVLPCLESA